jgi:hypothetical protein
MQYQSMQGKHYTMLNPQNISKLVQQLFSEGDNIQIVSEPNNNEFDLTDDYNGWLTAARKLQAQANVPVDVQDNRNERIHGRTGNSNR